MVQVGFVGSDSVDTKRWKKFSLDTKSWKMFTERVPCCLNVLGPAD